MPLVKRKQQEKKKKKGKEASLFKAGIPWRYLQFKSEVNRASSRCCVAAVVYSLYLRGVRALDFPSLIVVKELSSLLIPFYSRLTLWKIAVHKFSMEKLLKLFEFSALEACKSWCVAEQIWWALWAGTLRKYVFKVYLGVQSVWSHSFFCHYRGRNLGSTRDEKNFDFQESTPLPLVTLSSKFF